MREEKSRRTLRRSVAIGTNPERTREHNRRVVLEVIRLHGHLGRSAIAEHARLSPQAVANIVDDLLDKGLLVQLGRLRSGRGQPPIQFALNPDGPLTAGVEVAADRLVAVLLDVAGRVRAKSEFQLRSAHPAPVAEALAQQLGALCQSVGIPLGSGADPDRLLGIGVVMPGPFQVEGLTSLGPGTLPGWAGVRADALFAEALGQPVWLDNDANGAAVGERLHGVARQASNFCYVYFGLGLGLGIIQEGRPLKGAFGNAGEIGQISVMPRSAKPPAQGSLALESVASVQALRDMLASDGITVASAEDIERLHHADHPLLARWIDQAADYLAPTVALIENIFDPELVIFGGGLPDPVMARLIAALEPLPISVAARPGQSRHRVAAGQTGQLTAALGAASLPLLDTVSPYLNHAAPAG